MPHNPRKIHMLVLIGVMLAVSLGAACRKSGSATAYANITTLPVPEAKSEAGWPVYELPAEGFALELPPGWRQFDMDPKTFEAKFKEAMKKNPQLEPMLGSLRQQIAGGVKFFGFDEAMQGGFTTNINVIRLPLTPGENLDSAVADALTQYANMPSVIKPVTHERLTMATGDRERIKVKMTVNSATGQQITIATTQFILTKDKNGYSVTLTTTADQESKYAATFDRIGRSFRFSK